jgi:hypothetical protein
MDVQRQRRNRQPRDQKQHEDHRGKRQKGCDDPRHGSRWSIAGRGGHARLFDASFMKFSPGKYLGRAG